MHQSHTEETAKMKTHPAQRKFHLYQHYVLGEVCNWECKFTTAAHNITNVSRCL